MAEDLIFGSMRLPTLPGLNSTCEAELYKLLKEIDEVFIDKFSKLKKELVSSQFELTEKVKIIKRLEFEVQCLKKSSKKNFAFSKSNIDKNDGIDLQRATVRSSESCVSEECTKLKEVLEKCQIEIKEKNRVIEQQAKEMKVLKSLEQESILLKEKYEKTCSERSAKDKIIKQQEQQIREMRQKLDELEKSYEVTETEFKARDDVILKQEQLLQSHKKMLKHKLKRIEKLEGQLKSMEQELAKNYQSHIQSEGALKKKVVELEKKVEQAEDSLRSISESYFKVLTVMKGQLNI